MSLSIEEVYLELEQWLRIQEWKSYDPSDINSVPFCLGLKRIETQIPSFRYITQPMLLLAKRNLPFLRKIYGIKKKVYPQAQAMIARSYFTMYKNTGEKVFLDKGIAQLQWLQAKAFTYNSHICWGQPYNWFSKMPVPANTPRTTVTTQVIQAFIDGYESTFNSKYLEVAKNASWFLIEGLNWDVDEEGDFCLSYTPLDKHHIHNANMLGAAALIRTWFHSNIEKFKNYGIKAAQFTAKHQNVDGSWYYWAPPDPIKGKIDNYHTGFVLESFIVIKEYLKSRFEFERNLFRGVNFYYNNFFSEEFIPKMRPERVYPIDIQSCAQSILTFTALNELNFDAFQKAKVIAEWTIKEMYDPKGYFYYKINKSGKKDKTPYVRWGQSWMLRALAKLLQSNNI